jgi:hypothetical protein
MRALPGHLTITFSGTTRGLDLEVHRPKRLPYVSSGHGGSPADATALRTRALRLEAAAPRPWVLRLFAAVLTELLDALVTELFDAVLTELFVADLAATALPRDPRLLTCFDLEEAFVAATFGLLGVGDLAVLGLARIRGATVSTLAGLSTAVISGLCTAASDSPLLVDLDADSPRPPSSPPMVVTRAFGVFSARNKFRLTSGSYQDGPSEAVAAGRADP